MPSASLHRISLWQLVLVLALIGAPVWMVAMWKAWAWHVATNWAGVGWVFRTVFIVAVTGLIIGLTVFEAWNRVGGRTGRRAILMTTWLAAGALG